MSCWWVGWWLWCGLYLARHLFTLSSPSLFSLFFYYYRGGGGFIILLSLIRCFVHRTWGIGCSHFVEVILWLLVSNAFLMGSYIPKRWFLAFQRPWVVGSIGHEGWWRLLETFVYSSDSLYWRPDSLYWRPNVVWSVSDDLNLLFNYWLSWTKGRFHEKMYLFFWILSKWGGGALPNFCHLFISAFLVNKKSLFPQKCQCIELLTVF